MKKLMLSLFAVFFCFPTFSQVNRRAKDGDILSYFIRNQIFRDVGLYFIVAQRCATYLPAAQASDCEENVMRLVDLLDYNILFENQFAPPQSYTFVAFKKNLIALLSDPSTTTYLSQLNGHLNDYLTHKNPQFNIWDFTLATYKTHEKASLVMAALFQDTSLKKLHLAYLNNSRVRGRMNFEENKENLSRLIDTINLIIDYSEKGFRDIFYPQEIKGTLNRGIYHFYVPLYLSQVLKDSRAPILFTLTYESVTSASDYRYLFSDPARFDPVANEWKIKDIYGAYRGANFGSKKPMLDLETVKAAFGTSTAKAVPLLLK